MNPKLHNARHKREAFARLYRLATQELHGAVKEEAANGMSKVELARQAGVSRQTIHDWVKPGNGAP